jgi:hypothetical protein
MVWLTNIALLEEMYTSSEGRMGLQILCSKALSRAIAAESGGDLDRAERWAQWLQLTLIRATVILSIGRAQSSEVLL